MPGTRLSAAVVTAVPIGPNLAIDIIISGFNPKQSRNA